jgi:uncharacterized UBP type Zn finger protein
MDKYPLNANNTNNNADNSDKFFDESLMFLVENGGNTCYIDSLLMALFYTESHIDAILTKPPKQDSYVYLQEFIKGCFVDKVRSSQNVTMETINELRYILMNCGWLDADELFNQQDVNEFFTFIADKFDITVIELIQQTITDVDKKETSTIEKMPFIPLSLPYNTELQTCIKDRINVTDMFHDWLYKNEVNVQRDYKNSTMNVSGLSVYHIHNVPEFVALSINRFPTVEKRVEIDVIIQKKLTPFKHTANPDIKDIEWSFHAAVCHKGDTLRSGHYYSLLFKKKGDKDVWYIFDDQVQPCLEEVNMADKKITNQIKRDCVFLLYQLKLS